MLKSHFQMYLNILRTINLLSRERELRPEYRETNQNGKAKGSSFTPTEVTSHLQQGFHSKQNQEGWQRDS